MESEKKIRLSIIHKIMIAMLVVSLVPVGIIWYINYRNTIKQAASQVEHRLDSVSTRLTEYVEGWVEMNYRMLLQNAMLEDMISMDPERQNPILKKIISVYDWNYLAFTVAPDGQNIGRSDGKPPKYYGDRQYVQQVLNGKPMGEQVLIGKTSGKPAFVLAAPIYEYPIQKQNLIGVIAIAMTIADLSAHITTTEIGATGYAFLLDQTGKVIAHPSEEYTKVRKDLSGHPAFISLATRGKNHLVFSEKGKKVISYMKKTDHGWALIAQQDYGEAYEALSLVNTTSLAILVVTMIVVVLTSYLISTRLATPIRDLTEVADQLSVGKMDVGEIAGVNRKDEIGDLARAIDRLGMSVKYAMKKLAKKG